LISPDPETWFNGQFSSYILRPNQKLSNYIKNIHNKAAVHIRRSDKIQEANYFQVDEYMNHVEEHFNILTMTDDSAQCVHYPLFVHFSEQRALKACFENSL
jgi:hypothetical protein